MISHADLHIHLDQFDDPVATARAAEESRTALLCATTAPAGYLEARKALSDCPNVRVAAGLGDAPATIASEGPVSLEMERVISQGPEAASAPKAQRVLQLNAAHPVFGKLVAAKDAGDKDRLKLMGSILYDQALLVEGLPIDDPVEFAKNVTELM